MRSSCLCILFFISTNVLIGQADTISMHFRSLSITQTGILQKLDFKSAINSKVLLFPKDQIESRIPKPITKAFFCVVEDQIFVTSKIPIRMRLGSLDYTNSMEGKNPFDVQLNNTLSIPQY